MASQTASPLRQRAESIASTLISLPGVEGVLLFGSLARGEENEWSDIDLLVVGSDPNLKPTKLLRALPETLRASRMSLLYHTADDLEDLFAAGASFILHMRQEGKILADKRGLLSRLMAAPFAPRISGREELEAELERLVLYEDLEKFNGNFLFCLSQLYAIGKAVVIRLLANEFVFEFSREKAFKTFLRLHPEMGNELKTIVGLRPFYQLVTRREAEPLPFAYRGTEAKVREAVDAIRTIAAVRK